MNNTINVYISGTTGESTGTEGGFAYKISSPIAHTIETEEYSRGLTGNNITSTVAELYAMKYAIERIKAVNPSLMVKFNINNKSQNNKASALQYILQSGTVHFMTVIYVYGHVCPPSILIHDMQTVNC